MSNVLPFRDPRADLQGDELEAAEATAREYAATATAMAMSYGLKSLSRAPGCERLGCDSLLPILVVAARAQLEEWDHE